MAGRARTKALQEALEKRAREASDLDGELPMSTLDYVCEWIEAGQTIVQLAAEFTEDMGHEVTFARVTAVLRAEHGANAVAERLSESRVRASHCMAEAALGLVDAAADTSVDVSRAASRAKTRQWMAERYNPQEFGQTKHVQHGGSVGLLHLDALRAAPARVAAIVTGTIQDTANPPLITAGESAVDSEVVE